MTSEPDGVFVFQVFEMVRLRRRRFDDDGVSKTSFGLNFVQNMLVKILLSALLSGDRLASC